MILAPRRGFVLLSLPKAASTSLDHALGGYHEQLPGSQPGKHQNAARFHQFTAPRLVELGYQRDDYALVCMFRDPVSWLESWWRYRQRDHTRENRPGRYTGDIPFEEFVRLFVTDKQATGIRGRPAQFIATDAARGQRLDRIFSVERPDAWQEWFTEQVGEPVTVPQRNRASAARPPELADDLQAALREFFAPEYEVVDHLAATGSWAPPPGYVPTGLR